MRKVDKLIGLTILGTVLISWGVLVCLDACRIFIIELDNVGTGTYTLTTAVVYSLLQLPRRSYSWFGDAALIGSLIGLGRLATSSELTALRAAGMSKLRICTSAILVLAAMTAAVMLIGETIGPIGDQMAQALELSAKYKGMAVARSGALWARDGRSFINARQRIQTPQMSKSNSVDLVDVRIFEFTTAGRLSSLLVAKSAHFRKGHWLLVDALRTDFHQASVTTRFMVRTPWQSQLDPRILALGMVHPRYMSMRELSRIIGYLRKNQQDPSSFQQAYWARLFYPLNVLALAFWIFPFAFGQLRTGGLGKRIFLGIILAASFAAVQQALVDISAILGIPLPLSNALPAVILLALTATYFVRSP